MAIGINTMTAQALTACPTSKQQGTIMSNKTNTFTVVTDSKLLVSGTGVKPVTGMELLLKLAVNSDGSTRYSDTKHADGSITVANKLLFSNEYPEFSAYSFVTLEHFQANLADKLLVDESGVKFIKLLVVVPTFKPTGAVSAATL